MSARRRHELKLIAEVLPGKHSMTSVIEWALDVAMANTRELEDVPKTWAEDEADRFARTAFYYPRSLDHDHQRMWAFIRQRPEFWFMGYDIDYFNFPALRYTWDMISDHVLRGKPLDQKAFTDAADAAPRRAIGEVFDKLNEAAKSAGIGVTPTTTTDGSEKKKDRE
jgi:hypothetical protein